MASNRSTFFRSASLSLMMLFSLKNQKVVEGTCSCEWHTCRTITLAVKVIRQISNLCHVSENKEKHFSPSFSSLEVIKRFMVVAPRVFIGATSITHAVESSIPAKSHSWPPPFVFPGRKNRRAFQLTYPPSWCGRRNRRKTQTMLFPPAMSAAKDNAKEKREKSRWDGTQPDHWTARYSGVQKSTGNGVDRGAWEGVPAWKSWTSIHFGVYVRNASRICM